MKNLLLIFAICCCLNCLGMHPLQSAGSSAPAPEYPAQGINIITNDLPAGSSPIHITVDQLRALDSGFFADLLEELSPEQSAQPITLPNISTSSLNTLLALAPIPDDERIKINDLLGKLTQDQTIALQRTCHYLACFGQNAKKQTIANAAIAAMAHRLGNAEIDHGLLRGTNDEPDNFFDREYDRLVVNNSPWQCQTLTGHTNWIRCIDWRPDGQTLVTGSWDHTAKLWRSDGTLIATLGGLNGHTGQVHRLTWSPDGQTLATCSYDRTAKLWRHDGSLITTLSGPSGHTRTVNCVAWNPDGQTLATGSDDHTIKLWRREGTLIATLGSPNGHTDWIRCVAWSPDGQTLATCSSDHTAKLWRQDGSLITTLGGPNGHAGPVNRVAWSPDGQILATCSYDRTAKLWRQDGSLITTLSGPNGHAGPVNCVAWSPDSQILATGSNDGTVKLWHADGSLIATLGNPNGHTGGVISLAWNPDGQALATGSLSYTAKLWRRSVSAHANLSTLQKLLLLKCARQKTLTPEELANLQPIIDALPEPAVAFIAQCVEQQA